MSSDWSIQSISKPLAESSSPKSTETSTRKGGYLSLEITSNRTGAPPGLSSGLLLLSSTLSLREYTKPFKKSRLTSAQYVEQDISVGSRQHRAADIDEPRGRAKDRANHQLENWR